MPVISGAGEHPLVVVMGVSGSGKSTIGALMADALSVAFVDGDSLHSLANVTKMTEGIPLTDEDRRSWLAKIGQVLADAQDSGMVVACSALKRAYRDTIRAEAPSVIFLHLDGSRDVLTRRMAGRSDHFMPTSLLDSQLATLQRVEPDECGAVIDIDAAVPLVVASAVTAVTSLVSSTS